MENASKALIIAGAILLAIVIISLGLIVVNNVRDTVDNTNLSEQEIKAFNAKFTAYEGSNVSGSRVNSLIQQVIAINQAQYNEGKSHFVTILFHPSSFNNASSYAAITLNAKDGKIYTRGIVLSSDNYNKVLNGDDSPVLSTSAGILGEYEWPGTGVKVVANVDTGKNYTVRAYYKNGLVKTICAEINS